MVTNFQDDLNLQISICGYSWSDPADRPSPTFREEILILLCWVILNSKKRFQDQIGNSNFYKSLKYIRVSHIRCRADCYFTTKKSSKSQVIWLSWEDNEKAWNHSHETWGDKRCTNRRKGELLLLGKQGCSTDQACRSSVLIRSAVLIFPSLSYKAVIYQLTIGSKKKTTQLSTKLIHESAMPSQNVASRNPEQSSNKKKITVYVAEIRNVKDESPESCRSLAFRWNCAQASWSSSHRTTRGKVHSIQSQMRILIAADQQTCSFKEEID